ncbi:protein kinase C and casein kinase II substrate protein 3-like isoform X2 [Tigriopus californicus]|uniref:protein kinase C and casein kinase II substrate protein 3-like isoform X2 n=1 Tax=Tigriopus californicus TaxID=6832 RepID=UPI0027DA4B04|nr:protein kinase C and casein kinase II substrate protein 3-like isoform X2 [Tigriopus californicus]
MTMSHHSEDVFMAGSDSFWEPGNFKRTTKRVEDGHKLCTDLMTLIAERAEIEKMYAKSLKQWAAKWQNTIEKGPEYGTMEAAWKAVLVEADRRVTVHNKVKEDLNLGVNNKLKQWQKDNYHKSVLQFKEKKEMEDAFKKAQKPWAKYLGKVNKAKADYHNACKSEKSALNQERNATGDSALSQDQMRKLQDRVQKTKDQVQKSRENYEMAINDINAYNAKYMEDMTEVFEKCQRMEAQRLQCFKDILFDVQKCLNITENPEMPQIYEEFYHTVNNADHEQDLRWWSNTHGVNMAMNWPQFEEYMEEFRDIAKGTIHKKGGIADGSITLINQRHVGDDLPEYNPVAPKQNGSSNHKPPSRNNGHSMAKVPSSTGSIQQQSGPPLSKTANNGQALRRPSVLQERIPPDVIENLGRLDRLERTNGDCIYEEIQERYSNGGVSKDSNPFDEDEWEDEHVEPLVDNGEPGVKVRALYDYEAAEDDELNFKTGDIFEKLEEEDEQGWCKGRKDGKVGLYPANYIEVVD